MSELTTEDVAMAALEAAFAAGVCAEANDGNAPFEWCVNAALNTTKRELDEALRPLARRLVALVRSAALREAVAMVAENAAHYAREELCSTPAERVLFSNAAATLRVEARALRRMADEVQS